VPGVTQAAKAAAPLIRTRHLTPFNIRKVPDEVKALAVWQNNVQRYAQDSTRLGIPITIASDPRNHVSNNILAVTAHGFSQWCETLGLAAIGDDKLTRQFAEMSRQKYLAVGIREALHPQVDRATEPRWARISGTFGEYAALTARMATGEPAAGHALLHRAHDLSGSPSRRGGVDFEVDLAHLTKIEK
jgi:beta-glucosidase